ncbi:hypothetical protein CALVIDRAFT_194037 [Calocera viscosa TUFC12733]|uniref:Secreted protein n=1 Tax=Calocera viscosa (strain TUFC12733) TaxID=1330018 RepID=A0A167KRH2_CALVF|nr:hypothetical protein CALVIDRAFT_194037 [Calocera viscosa TUFC12733]
MDHALLRFLIPTALLRCTFRQTASHPERSGCRWTAAVSRVAGYDHRAVEDARSMSRNNFLLWCRAGPSVLTDVEG